MHVWAVWICSYGRSTFDSFCEAGHIIFTTRLYYGKDRRYYSKAILILLYQIKYSKSEKGKDKRYDRTGYDKTAPGV